MSDAVHQLRPGNMLSTANESFTYQNCVSDAMTLLSEKLTLLSEKLTSVHHERRS